MAASSAENRVYARNNPADLIRTGQVLKQYFDRDEEKRFDMEHVVGGGSFGLTWKLKYWKDPPTSSPEPRFQHIILKTDRIYSRYDDDHDEEDEDSDDEMADSSDIPNEKTFLEVLRWSKHIVNDLVPTNDPLARQFPGIRSHYMETDHWLYLEWLENGTLRRFADRAKQSKIQLPNRLLWRLFLCLLRMCIAMGWPPEKPEGENPEPVREVRRDGAPRGLIHGDMHYENFMFGNFIPDDPDTEHTMVPILKLIDLGRMREAAGDVDELRQAVAENIFDIGTVMAELITMKIETGLLYADEFDAVGFRLDPNGPEILTNGGELLPKGNVNPYPSLDTGLRDLVCSCLATRPEDRSPVSGLVAVVAACVNERDGEYYTRRGYANESDDAIRSLVNHLLFDAAIPQGFGGQEEGLNL